MNLSDGKESDSSTYAQCTFVKQRYGSSRGHSCHDNNTIGRSRDDKDDMPVPEMNLTISVLPSPKERRKDLTSVMAHLKAKLHDLDWRGFEQYADRLMKRYPDNADNKACILVHRAYAIRVQCGAHVALQCLEKADKAVSKAPSCEFIRIKYLTMKAFLLYFLGRRQESLETHQQAIYESTLCEVNSSSAHNLYYYALNAVLHNRDKWTSAGVPKETTW
jgi:hypothetical protein